VIRRDIDPHEFNLKFGAIGHMNYFRPVAQPLWDEVLTWFTAPSVDD
jgi:predicted alpha/beta hydrolase